MFSSCKATCPSSPAELGQGTWTTAGCLVIISMGPGWNRTWATWLRSLRLSHCAMAALLFSDTVCLTCPSPCRQSCAGRRIAPVNPVLGAGLFPVSPAFPASNFGSNAKGRMGFGSWLAFWLVWFGSWLAFWLVWLGSWLVWFGSWLAFWLVWFGSWLAFWLVWLGFLFFPVFLARLAETQLLGILQAYLGVIILQPHACTQRFRLRILRRTRSNAGRTSARSLSGRIESIWETPSKERVSAQFWGCTLLHPDCTLLHPD